MEKLPLCVCGFARAQPSAGPFCLQTFVMTTTTTKKSTRDFSVFVIPPATTAQLVEAHAINDSCAAFEARHLMNNEIKFSKNGNAIFCWSQAKVMEDFERVILLYMRYTVSPRGTLRNILRKYQKHTAKYTKGTHGEQKNSYAPHTRL